MDNMYALTEWKTYDGHNVSELLEIVDSVDKTMEIFYTIDQDGKKLKMIFTECGNLAVSRYDGISDNRSYLMITTENEYSTLKKMCDDEA